MARAAVQGADIIRKRLRTIVRNVADAVDQEMDDIAAELLTESREQAPQLSSKMIDTAKIVRSGSRRGKRFVRTVKYTQEYAPIQHEKKHHPGPVTAAKLGDSYGIATKFLSHPFGMMKRTIPRRLARVVEKAIRQSVR